MIVICELLGVATGMADQLLSWSHSMVAIYEHSADERVELEAEKAAVDFEMFIRSEIERKRGNPADDLLTRLIAVQEEGERLSGDELVATCMLLLNAGHEATVHGIGNGVKAMVENKVDVTRWMSTTEGAKALVEESLRFDSPLHMFKRFVLEDLDYQGQKFKRGDVIGLLLGAANRDATKFVNPHSFDTKRGGYLSLSGF